MDAAASHCQESSKRVHSAWDWIPFRLDLDSVPFWEWILWRFGCRLRGAWYVLPLYDVHTTYDSRSCRLSSVHVPTGDNSSPLL